MTNHLQILWEVNETPQDIREDSSDLLHVHFHTCVRALLTPVPNSACCSSARL